MKLKFGLAVIIAAGMSLAAGRALAQFPPPPGVTKDTFKCESSTGKALSKFIGSKTKCAQKCLGTQRKLLANGPYSDCFSPYGGTAATCIFDSLKGAEVKAALSIVKACMDVVGKPDKCPNCYDGTKCTDNTGSNPFVVTAEGNLDLFGPQVYCLESGSPNTVIANPNPGFPLISGPATQAPTDPSKEEGKCEDGLSKGLVKYVGAVSKCYNKCNSNGFKGKIDFNTCQVPATDPATVTCLGLARTKAIAALDKACFVAPAVAPGCYDGTVVVPGLLARPNNSAGWVDNTLAAVQSTTPSVACGSPSGAFLN